LGELGVALILFTILAFGHFCLALIGTVLDSAREFGLVLFVFAVVRSIRPGVFSALRRVVNSATDYGGAADDDLLGELK
jgi:hypothetical protein